MTVAEIVTRIASAADAIKAEEATALYIYGSRARGMGREESDLDVVVDCEPGFGFSLIRSFGRSSRRAACARDHLPGERQSSRRRNRASPGNSWRKVRAVGNFPRHEPHAVHDELVWRIVKDDLPALRAAVVAMQRDPALWPWLAGHEA